MALFACLFEHSLYKGKQKRLYVIYLMFEQRFWHEEQVASLV